MFNQQQDLVWVPGMCMYDIDFNICRLHTKFLKYYLIDHYRSLSAKSHPLYVVFFLGGGGAGFPGYDITCDLCKTVGNQVAGCPGRLPCQTPTASAESRVLPR